MSLLSHLTGPAPCPCCAYAHVASVSRQPLSAFMAGPTARRGGGSRHDVGPKESDELEIDGVTIVDPRDGGRSAEMTVRMKAGRIVAVVRSDASGAMEPGARIDGRGKYLVPGYNDMHSHVMELGDPSGALALMLAEGVTGFRQMSGSPALLAKRRAGVLPIGDEAPALHETPGSILTPFNGGTPEMVAVEVRRQKDQGASFIKVGLVNPDVFFAAITEANRVGIPILGHLQEGTDALKATAAGFRSVEHLGPGSTVWICCSNDEDLLRADSYRREYIKAPPMKIPFLETLVMKRLAKMLINPAAFSQPKDIDRLKRALDSYSDDKGEAVAQQFAGDGSWQVPTLVRLRTQEFADFPEYEQDPGLAFMPRRAVKRWRAVTYRFKGLPAEMRDTYRAAYPRQQALAKLFSDSGVRMMVGTDGGSFLGPGLTIRQEFKELADAGISPLEILRMATINAAHYLQRSDSMGTVEAGKDADLVLLDADPLESVENLHRISGVVRAGRYYSNAQLERLTAKVAATRGSLQ